MLDLHRHDIVPIASPGVIFIIILFLLFQTKLNIKQISQNLKAWSYVTKMQSID